MSVKSALRSGLILTLLTTCISISLFLKAGFVSVSIIWFFVLCLYNVDPSALSRFKRNYILFLPILFFTLHLGWIYPSEHISDAIQLTVRKIHLLLIPMGFIVVGKKITAEQRQVVFTAFLCACLMCSIVCLINSVYVSVQANSFTLDSYGRKYYFFLSYQLTKPVNLLPVYFSMFCNLAFTVALQTPFIKRPAYRLVILLHLALFICALASQTGIVTLVTICIIWRLTHAPKKIFAFTALILVMAGATIVAFNFKFFNEKFISSFKFNYTDDVTGNLQIHTSDKLEIWSAAIETIKRSLFLGHGIGDGQRALEKTYLERGMAVEAADSLNPHNEFLSVFLDFGLIGLGCLVIILGAGLIESIRAKDILTVCFLVIVTLSFLTESVLQRQKGVVFFAFFYSILFYRQAAFRARADENP